MRQLVVQQATLPCAARDTTAPRCLPLANRQWVRTQGRQRRVMQQRNRTRRAAGARMLLVYPGKTLRQTV